MPPDEPASVIAPAVVLARHAALGEERDIADYALGSVAGLPLRAPIRVSTRDAPTIERSSAQEPMSRGSGASMTAGRGGRRSRGAVL